MNYSELQPSLTCPFAILTGEWTEFNASISWRQNWLMRTKGVQYFNALIHLTTSRQDFLDQTETCSSKPEIHSIGLRKLYGKDRGHWVSLLARFLLMTRGDSPQALKTCGYVLKEQNQDQPCTVVWTNLSNSSCDERWGIQRRSLESIGKNSSPTVWWEVPMPIDLAFRIYRPLAMMLALTGNAEVNKDTLVECSKWACNAGNLCFGAMINLYLGRLGGYADSIGAEICTLLAIKVHERSDRDSLAAQEKCLVDKASDFLQKHRLKSAMQRLYQVRSQLETVAGHHPHNEFHNQDLMNSMGGLGAFIKEQLQIWRDDATVLTTWGYR